jgi:uncharacterized protein
VAISLYDASVLTYLQIIGAVGGFLELGEAYCQKEGISLDDIVETRLFPDMRPFRFQIQSVAHHSLGAVKGLKSGSFGPARDLPADDYAALQERIANARDALEEVTPHEINAREGQQVVFQAGETKRVYTSEAFLLTFSLPNFYFHATTAYDILRMKGVPVGKRNFMGTQRTKA